MQVRERPPLRVHWEAESPSGRFYRWGADEVNPANIPADERWSDTAPGGFESADVTLARKPKVDYSDLQRLSTIRAIAAGGEIAGEYRLESAPASSGDQMSVASNAVGHQAHLDDNELASFLGLDASLANWEGMSTARQIEVIGDARALGDSGAENDPVSGVPQLKTNLSGHWDGLSPFAESWYDAGAGNAIGRLWRAPTPSSSVSGVTGWIFGDGIHENDQAGGGETEYVNDGTSPAGADADYLIPTTPERWARVFQFFTDSNSGTDGVDYPIFWGLVPYGDHGLPIYGPAPGGLLASDVIAHVVSKFAPLLRFTTGPQGTIRPTNFVIPHLEFRDLTTASQILKGADRFTLNQWAVWAGPTFHYHEPGMGKKWHARIGPSGFQQTGPSVSRLWNAVGVQFQDTSGRTITVGPPGSRVDVESEQLLDRDPENPANQRGLIRGHLLLMNEVSTPAGGIEVGRRFLEAAKRIDNSGQATFTGHIQDDRGVWFPYHKMRSDDLVSFVDAADTSYRRVVKADRSRSTASVSVDLDAPPESEDALLERLGVALVRFGL